MADGDPFQVLLESAHSSIRIAVTWDESAERSEVEKGLTETWAAAMSEVDKRFSA